MADDKLVEEAIPKTKSPLVMIIVIVNVLAMAGGGAYFMLKGGDGQKGDESAEASEGSKLGQLVPLESFIVNLNEARSTRYLKLTLSVELANPTVEDLIKERKDVIRDRVLTYLSGLSIDDVRGSEPKEVIRDMLIGRVNEGLAMDGAVKNVLFTEFVVQ